MADLSRATVVGAVVPVPATAADARLAARHLVGCVEGARVAVSPAGGQEVRAAQTAAGYAGVV